MYSFACRFFLVVDGLPTGSFGVAGRNGPEINDGTLQNFDADLYSSTICALNFSKQVMDKDTILIFDELIMNPNWEQDEFKALNEFCSINDYSYEVIAISFFTKQVAVKLTGI